MPLEHRETLRILVVSEHASARFGGEAILPLHVFRNLRARGVETWMIVHERTKAELEELLPSDADRLYFISDTWLHKAMHHAGRLLPDRISNFTLGYISRLSSQITARRIAKKLISENGITLVHQPIPVSPREPSLMYGLGVPVVMGPLNGGMTFPPAWIARERKQRIVSWLTGVGRRASRLLHLFMPGKLEAATLLVANERTRRALPQDCKGRVITLVENGVDLRLWSRPADASRTGGARSPISFAFVGRLVDWKALDLALRALAKVVQHHPATLTVYGDGPMRLAWEHQAAQLGLADSVKFAGWVTQEECSHHLREADALVLPSLFESGGAVVLEAMAMGLPVIATNWGGPADYVDETCGILVDPIDPETFVEGLAKAMLELARSPELRERMGKAAQTKVISGVFNWEHKIDRILEIYRETLARGAEPRPHLGRPALPA